MEEKLRQLTTSKCDRREIQPIQESLVKAEASIAKLTGLAREASNTNAFYTKEEVAELLDAKMDKEEMENTVNNLIKKRRKRAQQLVTEGSIPPPGSASPGRRRGQETSLPAAIDRRQSSADSRYGNNGFPSVTPGVFRPPSVAGKPGGVAPGVFPPANDAMRSLDEDGNPKTLNKQGSSFGDVVYTGALSRQASREAEKPNGFSYQRSNSRSPSPPNRQMSRSASNGDDLAFAGAATFGGGFNTRSMTRSPTLGTLSNTYPDVNETDNGGQMLRGNDGHFYYASGEAPAEGDDSIILNRQESGGMVTGGAMKLTPK